MANQEKHLDAVNDTRMEDTSSTKDFMIGALIGGLIGAATALFLAPKSGRDLRLNLNEQAAFFKDKGEKWRDVAFNKGSGLVASVKGKKTNLAHTGYSYNEVLNEEMDVKVDKDNQREYVQITPYTASQEDVQKKLLDTQKALEEVEESIKG